MLKKLTLLLTATILALDFAAAAEKKTERKQSGISFYSLADVPETMEIALKRGDSITFRLEENPTTGYVWEAKYDRKRCRVTLKSRGAKAKRAGAPGLVEVKIKLTDRHGADIEFAYRRPFEKNKPPLKVIRCHVTNRGRDVAPDEPPKKRDKKEAKQSKDDAKSEKQK